MKFKDKVSRVALRVSLIAMVVLSIILSAVIWGSDARFSRIEETSNQTQTKDLGQRSLRDIYLPTQTFYFKNDDVGKKELIKCKMIWNYKNRCKKSSQVKLAWIFI